MKKILFASIATIGLSLAGSSQIKPVRTDTIPTPGALCENCKKRIESYVGSYDGIIEIKVDYKKGKTKVKYITDRINIEEIKAYIANCGYDAGDVPAAEDAYARLPKPCKKTEDGGSHPKPRTPAIPTSQ